MTPDNSSQPELPTPEQARARRAAFRAQHTHFVVSPAGVVTEHIVRPPADPTHENGERHGDDLIAWINGEPALTKRARIKGYRLLREVCEADGCPEKYQMAQQAAQARHHGHVVEGDPSKIYPPTVMRLRAVAGKGGTGKVFRVGEGFVEPTKAESIASKLGSLGIDTSKAETDKSDRRGGK